MKSWTKQRKIFLSLAALIVSIGLGAGVYATVQWANKPDVKVVQRTTVKSDKQVTVDELLTEVNHRRFLVGVPPVQIDSRLNQSAQQKCEEMAAERNYGHENLAGINGYKYAQERLGHLSGYYSENLTGKQPRDGASEIFTRWFKSEAHKKAALESQYTITGFGICDDPYAVDPYQQYIVEHFYSPSL